MESTKSSKESEKQKYCIGGKGDKFIIQVCPNWQDAFIAKETKVEMLKQIFCLWTKLIVK